VANHTLASGGGLSVPSGGSSRSGGGVAGNPCAAVIALVLFGAQHLAQAGTRLLQLHLIARDDV
jgi:hypothetical protein